MNLNEFNLNDKSVDSVLHEAAAYFQQMGCSVLNQGFQEIVSDPRLMDAYKEALVEGCSADSAAVIGQLIDNSANHILRESVSGIAPLTSLSMPVIRKLWPRVAMKDAIKTVVAKAPLFSISYTHPYMYKIDEAGNMTRKELPRGVFTEGGSVFGADDALDTLTVTKTVAGSDSFTTVLFGDEDRSDLSLRGAKPLDGNFEVRLTKADKVLAIEKMGLNNNNMVVKGKDGETDVTAIVQVDLAKAYAQVAVIGGTPTDYTVVLVAHKSSQWNESSWDVGFDIERQDIRIGTGEHLNAPLSVEQIQDLQALYNIDATAEVTDLMTNIFAQKLDIEIIDFLTKCYLDRPVNKEFNSFDKGYGNAADHVYSFNVAPSAGFAGSPTSWREELKPVIDFAATKIMQETYFTSGVFVIVGNPVDTALLNTIDWQFKGGNSGNVDGTNVNYSVGVYQGAYTYKVVSSLNVKPGKLMMSFIPSGDKQLTQVYYPYSFTMEKGNGYRSPNHSLVPSIMLTKRHTMFEYTPSMVMIVIEGNNGQGQFNRGNLYTNAFVGTESMNNVPAANAPTVDSTAANPAKGYK